MLGAGNRLGCHVTFRGDTGLSPSTPGRLAADLERTPGSCLRWKEPKANF